MLRNCGQDVAQLNVSDSAEQTAETTAGKPNLLKRKD